MNRNKRVALTIVGIIVLLIAYSFVVIMSRGQPSAVSTSRSSL